MQRRDAVLRARKDHPISQRRACVLIGVDLRTWAAEMEEGAKAMADLLASPEMRDWVATGRPPWPASMIVQALLDASAELAPGGWTSVEHATEWIAAHYPDEKPDGDGCRTWRQLIHESRLFDLQVRKADGRRNAWYHPRARRPEPP